MPVSHWASALRAALAVGMLVLASPSFAQLPCIGPSCGLILDHFRCYQARITNGTPKFVSRDVSLQDQFETIPQSLVRKPATLCNPVSKNGEPRFDPTAHLTCYATRDMRTSAFPKQNVVVTNQFGAQKITVQKPYQLCVPSEKGHVPAPPTPSALAVDHYRCYKAKPAKGTLLIDREVDLADQFETRHMLVKKCLRFCAPVSKNGELILDADAHLTCYKLVRDPNDTVPPFPRMDLNVEDQFGALRLTARPLAHLCVPSLKQLTSSPNGAFLD